MLNHRYFPASPVQCSTNTGSAISNGGAEAYTELAKALNILGDYRLSTACNVTRWAYAPLSNNVTLANPALAIPPRLQDWDYSYSTAFVNGAQRRAIVFTPTGGDTGSACFAAAVSLETSNGVEISGLNAEEQSDISFIANWRFPQVSGGQGIAVNGRDPTPSALECYVYYDAMIVLEMNNIVKLIQ